MTKKWLLGTAALFILAAAASPAPSGQFGAGLILIDPSGLSAKAWLRGSTAVAAGIGWSSESGHYLHIHADLLFMAVRIASDRNLNLDFYLGAGGKVIFRDYDSAWFRVPLGVDFTLRRSPLNFFFEVVPTFNFSTLKLFGAIGFRYTFTS